MVTVAGCVVTGIAGEGVRWSDMGEERMRW